MKFAFASANAAKLVRLPLYALAALLAWTMPRNRRLWVFGRKIGVGDGPLRLLHAARRYDPDIRLVWLAQDAGQLKEAHALGLESYLVDSRQGCWLTLRAGVGVVTHGLGDLYRPFVPGMRLVQLWHGAPLKLIHLDASHVQDAGHGMFAKLGGKLMRMAFAASARLTSIVTSPSAMVSERFRTAYGYPDLRRIQVTGDPRNDVLLEGDEEERREAARQLLCRLWDVPSLPPRLVLFAPTWRDGAADPTLPRREALQALDHMLEMQDAWLVVRSHPWGMTQEEDAAIDRGRVRFLDAGLLNDINRALNAFDILVTDYSAIAMDYSLLRRPIVFLAPDLADYLRSRGMYEDYACFTGGQWQTGWPGAIEVLDQWLDDTVAYEEAARRTGTRICRRYHRHTDAGSAWRVLCRVTHLAGLPAPREPEAPIRILHVSGSLGGVETYLQLLAEYHDRHRVEMGFVLPEPCGLSRYAQAKDMTTRIVPMRRDLAPWSDLKAMLALRRIVKHCWPDVMHLHSSKAGLLGRIACLGLSPRVVYTPHAYFYLGKQGWKRGLFLHAERWLDRLSRSHVLGTSPSEEHRAIHEVGCAPARTSHILNAVETRQLASHRVVLSQRRHVLLVARVSEQKNIPMYLSMVRRLRNRLDVSCYLVGVGHYTGDRERLDQLMREAGLQLGDMQVVPWMPREELVVLMASAAVVVLTSRYESFGYVLAEASGLGVPVIGTDVDGIRDVIKHGYNGFLVPLDDAAAMASHVSRLVEQRDLWNAISAKARDDADRRFDICQALRKFEAYYAGIIRER